MEHGIPGHGKANTSTEPMKMGHKIKVAENVHAPSQEDDKDVNTVWKHHKGGFEVSFVKLFAS